MQNPVEFTETQQFDFDKSVFAATAHLRAAKAAIDAEYGEGYAAANPALVGAFMQTAATAFNALAVGGALRDRLSLVAEEVSKISDELEFGVKSALNDIAASLA